MNNTTDMVIAGVTPITNATITTDDPHPPLLGPINAQALLEAILMRYPEYRLANLLNKYGYITEVGVGSITNLLALVVMLGLIHLPTCNYMAALALADLSVLLGPCLIRWLLTQDLDPRPHNTAVCRFLNFLTYWSFSFSAWLLVAMTVDRYIAITFPLKAIRLSTPRRARIIIVVLMIAMVLVNFHFLVTLVVESQSGIQEDVCVAYDKFQNFIEEVWPWIDAIVYSFLPFTLLIVFNFLIIKNHRQSVVRQSSMNGSAKGEIPANKARGSRKLTITLVIVAITFIIMTAPRVILMIIRPTVFNFKPTAATIDYEILAQYTLTSSLVNLFMFGNHCVNFFLYVLTGQKFRQQLIHTVSGCGKRGLRRIRAAQGDLSMTEVNSASLRRRRSSAREDSFSIDAKDTTQNSSDRVGSQAKPDLPTIPESPQDNATMAANTTTQNGHMALNGICNPGFSGDKD